MSDLPATVDEFLAAHDFSPHTVKAIRADLRKFVAWFEQANGERFGPARVTVRDVADFRDHLARVQRQAVSTTNRALVSIRRFLRHLVGNGVIPANPAQAVKELRRMPTAPKGLSSSEVRRLMREVELRGDTRAGAIMGLMAYAGLRIGDVENLQLADVILSPRSGHVTCRRGKGNKLRVVPLGLEARRLLAQYLETRAPVADDHLFVGERGPLTDDGLRAICDKYAAICGVTFTPHTLRHTFAHRFLEQSNNDLVALAQLLGHENLNTTAIYTKRGEEELANRMEDVRYDVSAPRS